MTLDILALEGKLYKTKHSLYLLLEIKEESYDCFYCVFVNTETFETVVGAYYDEDWFKRNYDGFIL